MKNTIKAITLTAVLAFGSTFAMAEGIIIGDRKEKGCDVKQTTGIIIGDRSFFSDLLDAIGGIIIGDRKEMQPCDEKGGIIIGDKGGIIIGDRAGIIIGD